MTTPDVFKVETLYPFRICYVHPISGRRDGCVRYFSTLDRLEYAASIASRPVIVEEFIDGEWVAEEQDFDSDPSIYDVLESR